VDTSLSYPIKQLFRAAVMDAFHARRWLEQAAISGQDNSGEWRDPLEYRVAYWVRKIAVDNNWSILTIAQKVLRVRNQLDVALTLTLMAWQVSCNEGHANGPARLRREAAISRYAGIAAPFGYAKVDARQEVRMMHETQCPNDFCRLSRAQD
jgi:hypothetical protein